jgi:hypothetical protein
MARREVFEKIGGYWGNTREDYELWARVLAAGMNIDNLAEPLLYYRVTDGSLSKQKQYQKLCLTNTIRRFICSPTERARFEMGANRCLKLADRDSKFFYFALFNRNKFNIASQNAQGYFLKKIFNILMFFFATVHPLVLRDSWHGFRSRMILQQNWKNFDNSINKNARFI